MGSSNRERRAAKQRRRDQKRGRVDGARPAPDRGLSADALRQVLRSTADDLATPSDGTGAGGGAAPDEARRVLTELRHVLAEHLARRRDEVLTACDEVLADVDWSAFGSTAIGRPAVNGSATGGPAVEGAAPDAGPVDAELVDALVDAVRSGATVRSWASNRGVRTEDAAVATVWVLARTRSADEQPSV